MATESPSPPYRLRIGIAGAARIARKTIVAIQHEASGCEVVAIASRSITKATDLISNRVLPENQHKIKIFSGDNAYQDLISSTNLIDAIYIPLPTTIKKEWTIKALRSNKHVLIEKPVAISATDYNEMISEAQLAKRYLMDGTMFVYHPRTKKLLEHIGMMSSTSSSDGNDTNSKSLSFGTPTKINATFTLLGHEDFMKNNIRVKKNCDLQGCIGDLGWYCIRFAQLVFSDTSRLECCARVLDWKVNEEGVPIDTTCLVTFSSGNSNINDDGKSDDDVCKLEFHCSYLHPWKQRATVHGTKQTVEVLDFVNPKEGPVSFQVSSATAMASDDDVAEPNQQKQQPMSTLVQHQTDNESSQNVVQVPCDISQITLMWKKFHDYCKAVEDQGWNDDIGGTTHSELAKEAITLSKMSCENQLVVDALMQSVDGNGKRVCFPLREK